MANSYPLNPDRLRPAVFSAPMWIGLLALLLVTATSSWFALRMTRFDGVAALWTANGLLTGALLLTPKAAWRWWFLAGALGQILARALVGDSALLVVGLTAVNLLECATVAGWVRRGVADLRRASSLNRVARDASLSTLAACALSALLKASARAFATAGMVAGAYHRCGLAPALALLTSAALMTLRPALGAAASSFSIQGS